MKIELNVNLYEELTKIVENEVHLDKRLVEKIINAVIESKVEKIVNNYLERKVVEEVTSAVNKFVSGRAYSFDVKGELKQKIQKQVDEQIKEFIDLKVAEKVELTKQALKEI